MNTVREYSLSAERGTVINGQKISLQVYKDDIDHAVNIEEFMKELGELTSQYRESANLTGDTVAIKTALLTSDCKDYPTFFGLGVAPILYSIMVTMLGIVTLILNPTDKPTHDSKKDHILGITMLNGITIARRLKEIAQRFVHLYEQNPGIVNVYLTFIGIPTDLYIVFLMTMTAATLHLRCMLSGLFFFTLSGTLIILFMPLILMLISTMLLTTLTISVTSMSFESFVSVVQKNIPTRTFLTYIADQIPPSVGRVEVTHQQQGK